MNKQMQRREAIKKTAWIMGGALSAPTMMGMLQGCSVSNEPNWTPSFFSEDQAVTIMDIADIIIPRTDTPGAVDVGVPEFIESIISEVSESEDREKFMKGFDAFQKYAIEAGSPFNEMNTEEKKELVQKINDEAISGPAEEGKEYFYMIVKELSVAGYCTSEAGATQVLKYDKVPGEAQVCIPFEEVGRTWATS